MAGLADAMPPTKLQIVGLSAFYGRSQALTDINLSIPDRQVTAVMGPSGCGKSTLVRCLNRIHETIPKSRVEGRVLLDGVDLYGLDATLVRRRVGMVFQRPNPFVTMSIYNNVAAALRFGDRRYPQDEMDKIVEESLRRAALWDEVKDRTHSPATSLSGGQQQRLCIARALAARPDVLLMDEPCSSLDPVATSKIEALVEHLKQNYAVVIVTHNMQQAARVSDYAAFLYLGKLIEFGPTEQLFERPKERLTEEYITGRFG